MGVAKESPGPVTPGKLLGGALVVFALGLTGAILALNRFDAAYGWLAHTSDVRLAIGRAVGHAVSGAGCGLLENDIDELATLTTDNPVQQARIPALRWSVHSLCAGHPAPQLIVQLSELDATERALLHLRRRRFASTRILAIVSFVGSMLLASSIVAFARWLQSRLTRALAASEERFRMMAAHASDLIRVHDPNGRCVYASPSCERLLGFTSDEMISMHALVQLGHPDDLPAMQAALVNIKERNAPASMLRYRMRTKGGDYRWFETHTDPVRDRMGNLVRFYTTARDITERVETQQQLEKLSLTDELTGLLNRRGFMMIAGQEHRVAMRQKCGLAVVFADLDGLKGINDTLGHELGDHAICALAKILRATFRESDVLARLGGDEFAILAYDVDRVRIETVLGRVRAAVAAARERDSQPYELAVSLGIAMLDPGITRSLDELLADADAKMYEVKRARKMARQA